tara:strand:+ start:825 stop:1199 length:375 start_codon:yes stop_codon:yes gene_type:complete
MTSKKKTRKSKGLGDDIAAVTKATGIDKLVKDIFGEDCGCPERQAMINKIFPYKKNWVVTADQYKAFEHLKPEFSTGRVSEGWRKDFYALYNEVTGQKQKVSSCSSCIKGDWGKLKIVIDAFDN